MRWLFERFVDFTLSVVNRHLVLHWQDAMTNEGESLILLIAAVGSLRITDEWKTERAGC